MLQSNLVHLLSAAGLIKQRKAIQHQTLLKWVQEHPDEARKYFVHKCKLKSSRRSFGDFQIDLLGQTGFQMRKDQVVLLYYNLDPAHQLSPEPVLITHKRGRGVEFKPLSVESLEMERPFKKNKSSGLTHFQHQMMDWRNILPLIAKHANPLDLFSLILVCKKWKCILYPNDKVWYNAVMKCANCFYTFCPSSIQGNYRKLLCLIALNGFDPLNETHWKRADCFVHRRFLFRYVFPDDPRFFSIEPVLSKEGQLQLKFICGISTPQMLTLSAQDLFDKYMNCLASI